MGSKRTRVLIKSVNIVMRPLQQHRLKRFSVNDLKVVEWKCVLLLSSYYCSISGGNDTSAVQYALVVKRRCVIYVLNEEDIKSGLMAGERSLKDTIMVRKRLVAGPKEKTLMFREENENIEKYRVDNG